MSPNYSREFNEALVFPPDHRLAGRGHAHVETRPTFAKDAREETIRQLEREILRKDKALADASALLILQKKSI